MVAAAVLSLCNNVQQITRQDVAAARRRPPAPAPARARRYHLPAVLTRVAVPTSTTEIAANALKDIARHRRQTDILSLALGLRAIGGKLDFVTPGRMRATLPVF